MKNNNKNHKEKLNLLFELYEESTNKNNLI